LKTVQLRQLAHARSGDKGNNSNIGLVAYSEAFYKLIKKEVTPARVKKHFGRLVKGEVLRYELPNLLALNFILKDSLGGGGSTSLRNDPQGKAHAQGLLLLEIEIPDELSEELKPVYEPEPKEG
jgi:hypothetical protein